MPKKRIVGRTILVTPVMPSYTLFSLPEGELVPEKIDATLKRGKVRDFFDLYFILRKGLGRERVTKQKEILLKKIARIDNKMIREELKMFLPRNYWAILGNFRENLRKELERR